jgi:ribose-phosphate pyrophosphokinase
MNGNNKNKNFKLISGNGNKELGDLISKKLNINLTKCIIEKFSNTECRVEILENVRKCDIFIIQSGSANDNNTINDIIMETMIIIDACKRSDAKTITLIMAFYPYCRQDKKDRPRAPISGKVVATMLEAVGINRLIVMDLHAGQIQGFFNIPVDNLYSTNIIKDYLNSTIPILNNGEYVLISPDEGAIKRTKLLAERLKLKMMIMHKERDHSKKSVVEKSILIGDNEYIKDKTCIILDDMVDTFGTIIKAAETLNEYGVKDIIVVATHGILSGPAIERLNESKYIKKLIVSNTLPQKDNIIKSDKIEIFDISDIFSKAINCIITGESISKLFD